MGQAKVPLRQPESFMKKHEREPVLPDSKKILKWKGKYGIKLSWIVKRYGKYRKNAS
jgi:hypothetical protein